MNFFFEFLNSLNMGENKYILNLKSKLKELHVFKKWIPLNIKTNAFNICVTHLWFVNTYIQFIFDTCNCNILHMIYDKNR